MAKFSRIFFILFYFIFQTFLSVAQVNSVTFGKSKVQYKKFNWQFYQTDNFNVYFYSNGGELAKYALQEAEKELPEIETAAEYSLQRRTNIIVYNNYTDFQQTNIGLDASIISTGSTTRLVNNKIPVYFDGDHEHLKRQIREGIADVITKNVLFGDDLGEVAGNQTLLDLPKWFTDGYQAYLGEHWNTELDDELKSEILSGNYSKFSKLCFEKPLLAGHAFWFFIEEKYKKENVTYFLYLSRTYKSMNKASLQITKKTFKELSSEFMEYQDEKYSEDIAKRKAYPKGSFIEGFDISPRLNYYRFNVNPIKKNNSYVVTQFKKGIVSVILNNDFENITLLKYGVRTHENEMHPNYPVMAWDPKGLKIAVAYAKEGKLKLFVYDVPTRYKQFNIDLSDQFDQIQDIKYMLDNRTLLISAVKNGHTDIYTFDIEKEKARQITNDVYDDLDPSFVSFPNKTGIIFASNRPSASAKGSDTSLPSNNRYNIFLITNFGDKPELNEVSQLSNLKYGNARFPAQYNVNHFTFVSDENGIGNRYAGFFTTKNMGLDTLVIVGEDILRNPSQTEIDSTLMAQNKKEVDSVAVVSVTADSSYTFPLTNYESSLAETRTAGEDRMLSEVTRQGDAKNLYKLKIDDAALSKRNITARPTAFAKKLMTESKLTDITPSKTIVTKDSAVNNQNEFQNEFDNQKSDSSANDTEGKQEYVNTDVLSMAKLFKYKPRKFMTDFGSAGFNNTILYNKYQMYGGGSGPIMLNSGSVLNGLITLGTSDLMEDMRITGGFKIGSNLKDNEWLVGFQNLRRRLDWGLNYYRSVMGTGISINGDPSYVGKIFTNLYQANVSYPFDVSKSIKFSTGIRADNLTVSTIDQISAEIENQVTYYSTTHLEYVYDNSLGKAVNILNGLRYKGYIDWNRQLNSKLTTPQNTFNFGFDGRYYYPIYKNFIWAGRAVGDFSWGNQKFIYYLGGTDGWLMFGDNIKPGTNRERYFNSANTPAADQDYAFQSLALNLRGHIQNAANGNNAVVINSEFRLPVLSTFFDRTVNNAFIRDFQITQFVDFGTAWNGAYKNITRPETVYNTPNPDGTGGNVTVRVKSGGVGPFVGGYGFGARSTLLGYFIRYDIGWPMNGFFSGRPVNYVSLGLDF